MQIHINFQHVFKSFGNDNNKTDVLKNITFPVFKGEFITFFGPNGCGKTTLLNIAAGFLEPDKGKVEVNTYLPQNVKIGFIFQNYSDSLFPWRNAMDNAAFPLELTKTSTSERKKIVIEKAKDLAIEIPWNNYPYQMSGGEQQLVAILRALLYEPQVLIMDEPFGALDYTTRFHMENKLLDIWEKLKITVLFVSHDLDEAIYLSDRLILLSKRPARIKKIINNPLPRPRIPDMFEDERFFRIKSEALKVFKEEVLK